MKNVDIWVSSCVEDGGAYRYRLQDEQLIFQQKINIPSPMWLTLRENTLWAILRAPFPDKSESAVASYDLQTGKQLSFPVSTQGVVACHMAIENDDIYVANYVTGSLCRLGKQLLVHRGKGINPDRQEAPHVHCAVLSPDKRFLLSCDLGLDTVFVYDRDCNEISKAKVPNGAGPRHLVFSKDGTTVFVANEMGASVSVLHFQDGVLTYEKTVSLLDGKEGMGSAIRRSVDGKRLYVSERKTNRIFIFSIENNQLTEIGRCDCHGDGPRDFDLIANDRYAVATNQWSGNVVLFRVEQNGLLTYLQDVPLPQAISVIEG